jgi:CMP-N-acetylneuraminic acid synthetase
VVAEIPDIDRAIVSTDSPEIAKVAAEAGLAAPFMRPDCLSGDLIGDVDVLAHALEEMENIDRCIYDVIVMLQPTSPLRTPAEVIECLRKFEKEAADSVWTMSVADKKFHPLKQLSLKEGKLSFYDPRGSAIVARQQLEELYFRNGVAYVVSRDTLINDRTLLGRAAYACVSDVVHISIDTAADLSQAELLALERKLF